jgi:hypothetical protein
LFFSLDAAHPGVTDKVRLKQILREDEEFRNSYLVDEEVFARLASEGEGENRAARDLDIADVFASLHENFEKAKKPLNFIAKHYLSYKKRHLFT